MPRVSRWAKPWRLKSVDGSWRVICLLCRGWNSPLEPDKGTAMEHWDDHKLSQSHLRMLRWKEERESRRFEAEQRNLEAAFAEGSRVVTKDDLKST